MSLDVVRLCKDHNIPYWTSGKNVRVGYVHFKCPICDDPSNHGGFCIEDGSYACWRCKGSHPANVLCRLLKISQNEAELILENYSTGTVQVRVEKEETVYRTTELKLPGMSLTDVHKKYLARRNFNPDYYERKYGLLGTGPASVWEGVDCRLRIIIPIYDINGRLVSWQGRDITNRQELRYKACPISHSHLNMKYTLYGANFARSAKRIIVVEGIFDQWRMGDGYVASYGSSLDPAQLALLARWEEILFLFDPEDEAQDHAKEYCRELAAMGRYAEPICADFGKNAKGEMRDCADLSEKEAQELRLELL